ncbi:hypothetical protein [Pleionea sp. CnH1-48]|uniref:hypothetical protein n=1 Tax=Pleionea sp. CnH1-48 TaxID=2954494 RepID=UPI0020975ACE|nr:hypothetical protein [Pleionea sp. CnH1-48]MCO7223941.1 hypothetical protein [Pleionea sp. CnH1-48]
MLKLTSFKKSLRPIKPVIDTKCYHCNNETTWDLIQATDWLTFLSFKIIPYYSQYHLCCTVCTDLYDISRSELKGVNSLHQLSDQASNQLHDDLVRSMKRYQLKGKTEVQRNFLRVTNQHY